MVKSAECMEWREFKSLSGELGMLVKGDFHGVSPLTKTYGISNVLS